MSKIDLDQVERVLIPNDNGGASDSRPRMKELLEKLADALGLDKEADEKKILEALEDRAPLSEVAEKLDIEIEGDVVDIDKFAEAITAKLNEKDGKEKPLEDRAKEEGKVLVDQEDFAGLKSDAKKGKEAADKLHERDFDEAFEKALTDPKGPRVDAKDETRERFRKLYDLDPEATLDTLKNLHPIANGKAKGSGEGAQEIPEGVDEDRAKLDQKAKAKMAEDRDLSYTEALDLVLEEEDDS